MRFIKYSLLCSLLFFISCDDGDIVLSDFEFDIDNLSFCYNFDNEDSEGNIEQTVFYNITEENDEVIFVIIDEEIDLEEEFDSSEESGFSVTENTVRYIKFDSFDNDDADDFFCTPVANNKNIERELNGTDGTISVITTNTFSDDGDEDGDGLTNEEEVYSVDFPKIEDNDIQNIDIVDLRDSDNDGIPDFRDEDDDNDNVRTSLELYPKDENGDNIIQTDSNGDNAFLDTDGDGNFNYLDSDDDNDGVPTWLEFETDGLTTLPALNLNENETLPLYLDPLITIQGTTNTFIELTNQYTTGFETIVRVNDLELTESGNDNTTTLESFIIGEANVTSNFQQKTFLFINDDGSFSFETYFLDENNLELNNDDLLQEENPDIEGSILQVPNNGDEIIDEDIAP